jgi:hypothetical protein
MSGGCGMPCRYKFKVKGAGETPALLVLKAVVVRMLRFRLDNFRGVGAGAGDVQSCAIELEWRGCDSGGRLLRG